MNKTTKWRTLKKAGSMLLVLMFLFQLIPKMDAYAAGTPGVSLKVSSTAIKAGDTVVVTLSLTNTDGISSLLNATPSATGMGAFTALIEYSTTMFTAPATANFITTETTYSSADYNATYDTQTGTAWAAICVLFNETLTDSSGGPDNQIDICTFTFTAKASGDYAFRTIYNNASDTDSTFYSDDLGSATVYHLAAVSSPSVAVVPAQPTTLIATAGNGTVDLSWTASTNATTSTKYYVYRSTSSDMSGEICINEATASSTVNYTDSTAVNGTTYYYAVKASDDGANFSVYSNTVSATPSGGTSGFSFSVSNGLWPDTISFEGTTYELIRYGDNTFMTADDLVSAITVTNGYVEVYDKSNSLLRSTKAGSAATTSTAVVSTGVTVKLYSLSDTLEKTFGLVMKGDIDGDGHFYASDVVQLKKHTLGIALSDPYMIAAGDIDGSKTVYPNDVTLLKRVTIGNYTIDQTK